MSKIDLGLVDISDAEDVLYYQALLSGIDDVIVSTDTNFIIKTWNAAAEKIYKLTATEAIGKKTTDILLHEYINTSSEEVKKILLKQNFWKGLVKVLNDDENATFLQSSLTIVKNAEGKKIGYIGVSRNVTNEINAKQSLHNFSSILTLLEESFLIVDRDFKIVFLRPKGNVQNFFNSNYKVGDTVFKYIPESYINDVKTFYEKAFAGETIHYDVESDEEPKLYFNITCAPLKDEFRNITNVCVIIKDFTAQQEMELLQQKKTAIEKSLFESRKLFEEFMENSPFVAWITDEKGIMRYMNPPYLKTLNFTKETIGKSLYELFPTELAQVYFDNNKKTIETNSVLESIEKIMQDNVLKTFKTFKFPIVFNEDAMVASWAVDISDQIAAQENLLQLNHHKDKLVSVMAHDVRGPLAINSDFIEGIIQDYDNLDKETLLKYLLMLKTSVSKSFNLTDELLTWAKLQLSKPAFNPKIFNIKTEILKVTDSLWDVMRQKIINLKTHFNFSGEIFADEEMFLIVLRNFISNAIKFSHTKGTITIETNSANDMAQVNVTDTGTGMRPELVKKILDKLNYESTLGTKGERGTGLGLNLAKDYIEQNGGTMNIKSKEGEGTNFYFTVPLSEVRSEK